MAAESVLEQQRKLHEERERLEDALVKERALKKPSVRRTLFGAHHTNLNASAFAGEGPNQLRIPNARVGGSFY